MGVTEETLRITNEIVYKGKAAARRLKDDVKTAGTEAKKTGINMKQLAVATAAAGVAFGVAAKAAQVAYDTLKEGAQIQATALTFDSLAGSIGSTSDLMLGELQMATRGTIDDMTLMQSASQFAAMGLANNSTEAAKLAEIGSTLGAAFRGDAAAGMEEFALLLANQSIPRLDSFGISAGAVRSRIAELQAEFPDMNRETAFMTAVMEEAETTMGKLGDTSDIAASQIAELESTLLNTKNEMKLATTEGALPLLTALNDLVGVVSEFNDTGDLISDTLESTLEPFAKGIEGVTFLAKAVRDNPWWVWFNRGLSGAAETLDDYYNQQLVMSEAIEANAEWHAYLATQTHEATEAVEAQTEELDKEIAVIRRFGAFVVGSADATERMADAHDQFTGAVIENIEPVEDLTAALDAEADALRESNALLGDFFAAAVEFNPEEEIDPLAQALFDAADGAGASDAALSRLGIGLGLFDEAAALSALKAATLASGIDTIGQAYANGEISRGEAIRQMEDLNARVDDLTLGVDDGAVAMTTNFVPALYDAEEALNSSRDAALGIKGAIESIPTTWTVDVLVQQSGNFTPPNSEQNYGNQGGGGTGGNAAGTASWQGGFSMVGEFGPEMVRLPRGAQVISTNQTHNQTSNTTINGSSRRAERMIQQYIRREARPKRMG